MINKIILNVSYQDKDKVKQLGAKWDPAQKVWYVPPGLNSVLFDHWLPKESAANKLIVSNIGLARTLIPCWSCKGYCTVCAIYCREITEVIKPKSPNKKKKKSIPEDFTNNNKTGFFFLANVSTIPESFLEFISIRCQNFRMGKVSFDGFRFYRNHCDHCSIGLSDNRLHKKYAKSKSNNLNLSYGFNPRNINESNNIEFIDLLFFETLEFNAEYLDYSNNKLLLENTISSDYLVDFI